MTNDQLLPFQRLDVYIVAKEFARRVHEAKISDAARVPRTASTEAAAGTEAKAGPYIQYDWASFHSTERIFILPCAGSRSKFGPLARIAGSKKRPPARFGSAVRGT